MTDVEPMTPQAGRLARIGWISFSLMVTKSIFLELSLKIKDKIRCIRQNGVFYG